MKTPAKTRPVLGLASFAFWAAMAPGAEAATGSLTASVAVDTFCSVSASGLSFGAYDPILTNRTTALNNGATATVTVTCVKGTAPTIALGLGTNASGTTRRMKNAAVATEFLTYELYKPPTNTAGAACTFPGAIVWGSSGTNLFSPGAAPNKNSRTYNVCGTVPAGQNAAVGTYSDTVVVTVSF